MGSVYVVDALLGLDPLRASVVEESARLVPGSVLLSSCKYVAQQVLTAHTCGDSHEGWLVPVPLALPAPCV